MFRDREEGYNLVKKNVFVQLRGVSVLWVQSGNKQTHKNYFMVSGHLTDDLAK